MKNIKKLLVIAIVLSMAMVATCAFTACQDSSKGTIGIIQFGTHESLNDCYNGIILGLKEELGWGEFNIPDATFYLWLPIPPRYESSIEFTEELMHKSGVIAVPGDAFGEYGKGFFRVSIVCSEEELKEAIRRMKEDGFTWK